MMIYSDELTEKIEILPDIELQTDRLHEQHRFHCPKCGKISPVNYVPVNEKTADMCDIAIHCDVCGDTVLEQRYVKHKSQIFIKGTETKYDRTKWLKDAEKKMKNAGKDDLRKYVEICFDCADEMRLEGMSKEDLYVPYLKGMSALVDDLKNNGLDNLQYACEQSIRCNDIGKLELLDAMRSLYYIATMNSELLPVPLYETIAVERELLESAYSRMFYDEDEFYDRLMFEGRMFMDLSEEERLVYPYTASNAFQYALSDRKRYGTPRQIKNTAKELIAAIEDAVRIGAPIDRHVIKRYLHTLDLLRTKAVNPYKKAVESSELWKNDRFYVGYASSICLERMFNTELCDDDKKISRHTKKKIDEAIHYADLAIENLKDETEIYDIGYYFIIPYCIRGVLTKNDEDMGLALRYADYFNYIDAIDYFNLMDICNIIIVNTPNESQIHKEALSVLDGTDDDGF